MDKKIIHAFRLQGLSLRKDALFSLKQILSSTDQVDSTLNQIIYDISKHSQRGTIVDSTLLSTIYSKYQDNSNQYDDQFIHIYSAFHTPLLHYDSTTRHFSLSNNSQPYLYDSSTRQHNSAESYSFHFHSFHRLAIVKSRVSRINHSTLLPIESLIGIEFDPSNPSFISIIGIITRNPSNPDQFIIEDQHARVPIDLSSTEFQSGFFNEGMIVIALGIFQQSIFYAHTLSHPPPEQRSLSLSLLKQIDYLDIPQDSEKQHILRQRLSTHPSILILLSDIYLDIPQTFDRLRHLFQLHESSSSSILFLFIGDYFSPSFVLDSPGINRLKRLFDSLASLIASFPSLITHSFFFFLPGSRDIASDHLFPRQPLPSFLTSSITSLFHNHPYRIHISSNPSRLRVGTQEICVFDFDLLRRLSENAINRIETNDRELMEDWLVKTVIRQGTLIPFSPLLVPRCDSFEPFLRLFPLPDILVLSEGVKSFVYEYSGCKVLNVGSLMEGGYVLYDCQSGEVELNEL